MPKALLRALLAAVVGDDEPPVEDPLADEFSAAAITAATASTSIPGSEVDEKVRVGIGGPLGNATIAGSCDVLATCRLERGGATG